MPDEVPPINPNGATRRNLALGVVWLLTFTIMAMAVLAGICVFKPPQEWTLLDKVIGYLDALALLLAGGILGALKGYIEPR